MNRGSKTRIGVLAAILSTFVVMQAKAAIVSFQNPPGAGHYDWAPPAGTSQGVSHWMDIAQPASAQPGDPFVESSFRQDNFSDLASKIGGGGSVIVSEIQVGNNHPSLALASAFGEMIPAEAPLPPNHGWAINPFTDHPSLGSNFVDGEQAYLGVRFDLGSGWQYGWIGVVKNGIALDAFAWGYETEPGVPIAAGIPEPTTLALFALAAGSLVIRRKR